MEELIKELKRKIEELEKQNDKIGEDINTLENCINAAKENVVRMEKYFDVEVWDYETSKTEYR